MPRHKMLCTVDALLDAVSDPWNVVLFILAAAIWLIVLAEHLGWV